MSAIEAIREGNLQAALQQLQQEIRSRPADAKLRVFLFQLLVVKGDWQRASDQLAVAQKLDASTTSMAQTYEAVLHCERLREAVFAGRFSPLVFGEPSIWIARLIEALRLAAHGEHDQATALRQAAFEEAPALSGQLNGEAFTWIADADSRLGPVLELIVNGKYYWTPFERIRSLRLETPTDLRDLVWTPAYITWANGGEAAGFIPTRYAGTLESGDDALLLARATQWQEPAPGCYWGLGQRLLSTDQGDYSLLDIRHLELNSTHAD